MCRLTSVELDAAESSTAWALSLAAASAGDSEAVNAAARRARRVTSGQRMTAAAVLREAEEFDEATLIAVVDAAARWLDEPAGDE